MMARKRPPSAIDVFVDENVSSFTSSHTSSHTSREGGKKKVVVKDGVGVGKKKVLADITNSASSWVDGASKKQTRILVNGTRSINQDSSSHYANHVAEELDPYDIVHRKASKRSVEIAPCCCVFETANSSNPNEDLLYSSIASLERDFAWHTVLFTNNASYE